MQFYLAPSPLSTSSTFNASSVPVAKLTSSFFGPLTLPSGCVSIWAASSVLDSNIGSLEGGAPPGCRLPLSLTFFSFFLTSGGG